MVFDKEYSSIYDTMYAGKDYAGECDYLEKLFKSAGVKPRTILDLGCGTGSHAVPLAKRGYRVTGVDLSPGMLAAARRKAGEAGASVEFRRGDISRMRPVGRFDAVICMFAVMGYQLENERVAAACRLARRSLKPGGIFVFDCWYGSGVLTCPPGKRRREVPGGPGERIIRYTTPQLDALSHTVRVHFRVRRVARGRSSEHEELHVTRFFFPQEIKYYLSQAGFKKIDIYPFMETGRKISPSDWNMAVAAR